jgi:Macrocin-O-methyltransferase (TylF)
MLKDKAPKGDLTYYEFGVGWGGTLTRYIDALKAFCRETKGDFYKHQLYLFDSYKGLPEKQGQKDDHPGWDKGVFGTDLAQVKQSVALLGVSPNATNFHFIKGFYEKALTEELRSQLSEHPPSIITVDVDYYSSCKLVLDWLRPLLKEGTLFYFDDIWEFYGNPNRGELGAINEFNQNGRGKLVAFPMSDYMLFIPGTRFSTLTYAYVEP